MPVETTTSSLRIPIEICEDIIDILALEDPSSLKNCSLTSRLFVPRSRSHIFHSIVLGHSDTVYRNGESLDALLSKSPEIAFYIRNLRWIVRYVDFLSRGLMQSFQMLHNLESFHLGTRPNDYSNLPIYLRWQGSEMDFLRPSLQHILQLPTLRALHLDAGILQFPVSYIRNSSIKSLELSHGELWDDEDGVTDALRSCPLESISVWFNQTEQVGSMTSLVQVKGQNGRPVIDVTSLKEISVPSIRVELFNEAWPLFQGGNLSKIKVYHIDDPLVLQRLPDYLGPALERSLRHLILDMTIREGRSASMSLSLMNSLSKLRGTNCVERIELILGVDTDMEFDIPMEWRAIDEQLAGDGWPRLRDVKLTMSPATFDSDPSSAFCLALRDLPKTHFTKLAASSKVNFDFLYDHIFV
ncbi:hypothetical protein BXZ70DRAFT_85192 [Cristinia sonorae]|uniref:F-box domain-containing protein n=1 Tax=Cristinia sonorae TaxID=1940300 RepID=A0A8K0US23_9AGAR|nr:hypothetical protein BXZ70DRAFT_85192 [Cristinia sonorae]